MSIRLASAQLVTPGILLSAYASHGVRGDAVPSTGTHGNSPLFNDLALPADAAKEYRWSIVTPPAVGTLTPYEDGSYSYTPPGGTVNLAVTYTYRLWQDGVDLGTATESIVIGAGGNSYSATMATLTSGATYAGGAAVYAAPSGAGPTNGPTSDISAPGWTAVPSGSLYSTLDESSPDDADYITTVIAGASPAVMGIGPLPAGTYTLRVRAGTDMGSGVLRVRLQATDGAVLATSADQAITTAPTTFTLTMTITATATRVALEVA